MNGRELRGRATGLPWPKNVGGGVTLTVKVDPRTTRRVSELLANLPVLPMRPKDHAKTCAWANPSARAAAWRCTCSIEVRS